MEIKFYAGNNYFVILVTTDKQIVIQVEWSPTVMILVKYSNPDKYQMTYSHRNYGKIFPVFSDPDYLKPPDYLKESCLATPSLRWMYCLVLVVNVITMDSLGMRSNYNA